METNKQYYIGVRFDEGNMQPIICNGGKIFEKYEICRHYTVDNAEVMKVVPMTMPSNELTAVENITKALQEKVHRIDQHLMDFRNEEPSALWDAKILILQVQKETLEKAITIAKTLF